MKTKVNKLVKIAAAGLFLIALAINVKVTMDDPFTMVTEQALASDSGGGGTGGCNGNYTRSVRNYNITNTPENNMRRYDEDDCIKKWCEYATLSGWCCFYD